MVSVKRCDCKLEISSHTHAIDIFFNSYAGIIVLFCRNACFSPCSMPGARFNLPSLVQHVNSFDQDYYERKTTLDLYGHIPEGYTSTRVMAVNELNEMAEEW